VVKIVEDVIHTLRDHPFALVIIVINVLFIGASTWTLQSIAEAGVRRDTLIAQMVKDCKQFESNK
jgi:hypothetical protein